MVDSIGPYDATIRPSDAKPEKTARPEVDVLNGEMTGFGGILKFMAGDAQFKAAEVTPAAAPAPETKVIGMDKLDVLGWERAIAVGFEAFDASLPAATVLKRIEALGAGLDNVRSGRHLTSPGAGMN